MQLPERSYALTANGLAHHVLEWGSRESAESVLLVHGFLDAAVSFVSLAPLLAAAGYRVIAPDLRGHGRSSWVPPGGYYYFSDYVLDLHELLPQLDQAPIHIVGHSMGGGVVTLYAALHPERVRTLTLAEGFGPGAEAPEEAPARMGKWLADVDRMRARPEEPLKDTTDARRRLSMRHPDAPDALLDLLARELTTQAQDGTRLRWRYDPLHRTRSPMGLDRERFGHFARTIQAPTLLLQGERGLRWGDEAERFPWFRNARQALIPNAGHMMHWTHPEIFAAHILAHVR